MNLAIRKCPRQGSTPLRPEHEYRRSHGRIRTRAVREIIRFIAMGFGSNRTLDLYFNVNICVAARMKNAGLNVIVFSNSTAICRC